MNEFSNLSIYSAFKVYGKSLFIYIHLFIYKNLALIGDLKVQNLLFVCFFGRYSWVRFSISAQISHLSSEF